MTKNALKYFVTALLFVDLSSIAVLGLLLAFVIPSGRTSMEAKVFFRSAPKQMGRYPRHSLPDPVGAYRLAYLAEP
jgi:hypothetical protein